MNEQKQKYAGYLETAIKAARAAGAIQKERFGSSLEISHKGEADLVTEVDLACEETIRKILNGTYPDHAVLGEEKGVSGAGEYRWVVDPLDGTTNFAHAYPLFCASVALEERGRVVVGAVYDPLRDELFTATRGGGAYLNGKPIRPTSQATLENAMIATGFPYDFERRTQKALRYFTTMVHHVQAIRRDGSAALNLCYVACGRFDGFWEISLHEWDVAAGWLIIEEAGGKITGLDGAPTTMVSEEMIASNGPLHDRLVKILASVEDHL